MLTRRRFLLAGATTFAALSLRAQKKNPVPEILDHILLGCRDLGQGISFLQKHLGVRAAFGGVHPGRGTQNALLSLGDRHYLEIIAPDPAQLDSKDPLALELKALSAPQLVGWAAHPGDLVAYAKKLRASDISFEGPTPGSRMRPDGRLLQWKTLNLENDALSLLPFFIEWSADSPHPSSDAPKGCQVQHFELVTPDPAALRKTLALMSLDVTVNKGEKPQIRATFRGPGGELSVTS